MRKALLTIVAIGLLVDARASAQIPDAPPTYRLTGARMAFAQDIRVERDEEVTDAVVVIGGSAIIEGRVRDGIVIVGGNLHLSSTADVRGDIVLVGGRLVRDPGAQLLGGVNYVSFGDWSRRNLGFLPSVRFGEVGRWLGLAGTLARISVLAVLMALILIVARGPVARVGRAALAEPLKAFVIGFAAEIFFIPVLIAASIGLAITIIGIPFVAVLIPLAIVIAIFAFVLGFTALACRVGEWVEDRLGWQPGNAFIATTIGFIVLLAPTMIARFANVASERMDGAAFLLVAISLTVELIAWTIGFGAAILTGLGRWYTVPPPITTASAQPNVPQPA